MIARLSDQFDVATLERGRDYLRRGLVVSVEILPDASLRGAVSNERGRLYRQEISTVRGRVNGICTCPVGHNCKHVAAALLFREADERRAPGLAAPLRAWLGHLGGVSGASPTAEPRPEDYTGDVKDRLLYVLRPLGTRARVDIYKGRINAAGNALNASIRRYDALHALRSAAPAKFIRPVDIELLAALAQSRLWDTNYSYAHVLPDLLRPKGEDAITLIRRLCATGRFLHDNAPGAGLVWSNERPAPRLAWRAEADGGQHLGFVDESGRSLDLCALEGATLWTDARNGRIGAVRDVVGDDVLQVVKGGPPVAPHEAEALAAALPARIGGLDLPRPRLIRQSLREARQRFARLTLDRETVRTGPRSWGPPVYLPALILRFVYDGQEVRDGEGEPRVVEDGEVVTLLRDAIWEADCAAELMLAGALPMDDLTEAFADARRTACDFVFPDDRTAAVGRWVSTGGEALDFAFRVVPRLRGEGWEVIETPRWPYRLSETSPSLTVTTRPEKGERFAGADWFSLGFQTELDGKAIDVAQLVAVFLEQLRGDWPDVPDPDTLARHLAERPVYLDRGKQGYAALDLSPLAPLLHLFLTHHAELGALHPSDAGVARLAEEALAGSAVRFSDHAGILPLARSLRRLSEGDRLSPPVGLKAELRDYQVLGSVWMGRLLEAGFGAVLADDMGLGKTVQTLGLLQARREAGEPGPALLIVPTSLLHGWQAQAARFTPGLRLTVLHGPDRAALRDEAGEADLVLTTYPLLARDRDWLAGRDWPLVILDEAQTLKNPASQTAKTLREIPARGRVALTGTPLENSLQDLWTLVDWVNPGLLGDRQRFQALFRTPIEKHGDAAAQARLNRRLRPFLLRRTKAEVAAELPPRTEILERVELPKAQQALYETVRSAMNERVREAIRTRGLAASRITVLDALLKLRQVCCDPSLVKTDAARSVRDSAKRTRLLELLTELVAEGRRVLVFSQFVEMLRLVEADLAEAGIACLSLTGRTKDRAGVLDAFARGDAPVFLLSLKAGGVGLTLTEADTVILYDPWWNPAVERQAMDRAHRIGQDKPVFVHRLVAAGTVEERILDLQARKQALADALFDGEGDASVALLDETALHDLFAPLTA